VDIVLTLIILCISIVGLYYGAIFLIKGAVILAERLKISKMMIGLTVVAAGTSMPEFFVSFLGGLKGKTDIAVGNIVGSNITNLSIVLGVAGLILPLNISKDVLKRDYPIVIFTSIVFVLLTIFDGIISRLDGIILFAMFLLYIYLYAKVFKVVDIKEVEELEKEIGEIKPFKGFFEVILGVVLLYISSEALIYSSVKISKIIGVSETVIGLSIVALGTSIPELFTSAIAAFKEEPEISLGNVIGSNFLNLTFILGLTSIVHPLPVGEDIIKRDNFIMLFAYIIPIIPILRKKLGRIWSSLLALFYIIYIIVIYKVIKIG